MTYKENEQIWKDIDRHSIEFLNTTFNNIALPLVEFLIKTKSAKPEFEISTFEDGPFMGSSIIHESKDHTKRMELRCRKNSLFAFILHVQKAGGKYSLEYKLSAIESRMVPIALQSAMNKVRRLHEPAVYVNNTNN